MTVDSLEELGAAFREWRSGKKHSREAMPPELLDRARRAAEVHGPRCVARAAGVRSDRLRGTPRSRSRRGGAAHPAYSRVELTAPGATRPFAELEMPSGVKVRFYEQTEETLALLSSMFGAGGAR